MNRKQRRAQEAKTRQGAVLEAANRSAPMYDKIYAAEAKTASEMLADTVVDRQKVTEVVENAIAFAGAFNKENLVMACGAGCHYCCYQLVGTNAVEIVQIATFIRERFDADARAELVKSLVEVTNKRKPGTAVPARCTFLDAEGLCRIYDVRPLACRSVTSESSEPCRQWLEEGQPLGKVADRRRYTAHMATLHALDRALSSRGLQGGFLDFHAALLIALEDETAVPRWYAGEHPFSSATIAPGRRRLLPVL